MDATARQAKSAPAGLEDVRRHRAELRETMGLLERALAAPASGRGPEWGERVHAALAALVDDFGEHVLVNEGPGGLHQAILAGDLRLANGVRTLATEHGLIAADIAAAVAATEPPVTGADVDKVRALATRLLGRLVRHRQRGAELIYEAYAADLGGGD
jgi:hypothetical protein